MRKVLSGGIRQKQKVVLLWRKEKERLVPSTKEVGKKYERGTSGGNSAELEKPRVRGWNFIRRGGGKEYGKSDTITLADREEVEAEVDLQCNK